MAIQVHRGVLKELGDGTITSSERISTTLYSYIEIEGGQMLRDVLTASGLDGKLNAALDSSEPVELHVQHGGGMPDLLIALRLGEGRIFATDLDKDSGMRLMYALVACLVVMGVALLPILGAGLIPLFMAWRLWKKAGVLSETRAHVRGLPNAVTV